jgi:membrane protein implicated in regulation of membrane protease activity
MGTPTAFNGAYAGGALVVSAVLGLITGSWWVFGVSLVILLALSIQSKPVRPRRSGCRCRNR